MRTLVRRFGSPLAATGIGLLMVLTLAPGNAVAGGNVTTPGNFTGYGFDQCLAPEQRAMDRWLNNSPFLAVGIYISGDSRGCRSQPNLTRRWISSQLDKGWRLLPITLGPQASCSTNFPRYDDDETIDPTPGSNDGYPEARAQGRAEGRKTVRAAAALGISEGSTLWYDLEGFDHTQTRCRESALRFLSSWVTKVSALGYKTGVYSSAASGIVMLDSAMAAGRNFAYPDYIWIARWDGEANTSTSYISDKRWNPHRRVKQYEGGHNETWGGVTINIDRDYLDVGRGTVGPKPVKHCGGVRINWWSYKRLAPGNAQPSRVKTLQCLLKIKHLYAGQIHGRYNAATIQAANKWQRQVGATPSETWTINNWVTLLADGSTPVLKIGSGSYAVRRLQRTLNAALAKHDVKCTGVFGTATKRALRAWQRKAGLPRTGVAASNTWAALQR
jgi:Rv2525c-like, glycoside hydrolase-like domain/Putative peptidoglycan binding domain